MGGSTYLGSILTYIPEKYKLSIYTILLDNLTSKTFIFFSVNSMNSLYTSKGILIIIDLYKISNREKKTTILEFFKEVDLNGNHYFHIRH